MKRVGIISLFYKSLNYGGTLQAYALCRYLADKGYDAKQISFDLAQSESGFKNNYHRLLNRMFDPDVPFRSQVNKYIKMVKSSLDSQLVFPHGFDARRNAFENFRHNYVPATKRAYTTADINDCAGDFDAFVAGSDIVWNPFVTDSDVFFMSFAPKDKPKIAYAASLGVNTLGDSRRDIYRRRLKIPDAISTREKSAELMLSQLTEQHIETVIDPTLLLDMSVYDKITAPDLVKKPYIFCNFLGGTSKEIECAKKIAAAFKLPVVTIPSPGGEYHRADDSFGNIHFYDAGPCEFLSLVKNARAVLTDSFHTIAFSTIFEKKFLAIKRHEDSDPASLNSRLNDFLISVGLPERIVSPHQAETAIKVLNDDIDYSAVEKRLNERRKASEQFLLLNLG